MLTCQQCRDEMAEYALGHSGADAATAVAEHLSACVVCRREMAEIESAWSALALALEPADPAPAVLQRVLDRIDQANGSPPPQRATTETSAAAPLLTRRQRFWSYALAASVLAALVGGSLYLRRTGQVAGRGDTSADQALHDLAARLGKVQELEQMLDSGNVRLASLYPPTANDKPGAYIVWDTSNRQWHFYALALQPAPAGMAYQLWAVAEGAEPLPGPTFDVDVRGLGKAVADFPTLKAGSPVKAVVTLEPAAGSAAPTGDVVLEAPL